MVKRPFMGETSNAEFSIDARVRARHTAVQVLYQWILSPAPIADIVDEFINERKELAKADHAYFRDLSFGVARERHKLDERLAPLLDRALDALDPVAHAILWIGLYELLFHPEIAYRIVLDEAVELGKLFGAEKVHKYINGVLDKAVRTIRANEIDAERTDSGSEFQLIRRHFQRTYTDPAVCLGIGDDAAVVQVPTGMALVTTMDTLSSGVHFTETTDATDIAYKSLAVNFSDLAAMGAVPKWALLSLSLPHADEIWLERFADQFHALAKDHGVSLVGGDLVAAPLSVTVQLQGLVPHDKVVTRSGARVGDVIFVTGTLGDAGVGLKIAKGEYTCAEAAYFLACLKRPSVSVEAGLCLRDYATSAIDVSDGLVADLQHILTASGVGAEVRLADLPLSEAMQNVCDKKACWRYALTAGDDYCLCFTVGENECEQLSDSLRQINIRVTQIGKVTDTGRLVCKTPTGEAFIPKKPGYRHF